MSEELIVCHCSPTRAGLKTGNMFTCSYEDKKILMENICKMNKRIVPRGLRLLPLRYDNGRALIYMYRPEKLKSALTDKTAEKILSDKNYPTESSAHCVTELINRLRKEKDFPHEIGLFLGYPSEDVKSFIENKAQKAKYVGTWKVFAI